RATAGRGPSRTAAAKPDPPSHRLIRSADRRHARAPPPGRSLPRNAGTNAALPRSGPSMQDHLPRPCADIPRRRFVQGLAAGGAIATLGLGARPAHAIQPLIPVLAGDRFDLAI